MPDFPLIFERAILQEVSQTSRFMKLILAQILLVALFIIVQGCKDDDSPGARVASSGRPLPGDGSNFPGNTIPAGFIFNTRAKSLASSTIVNQFYLKGTTSFPVVVDLNGVQISQPGEIEIIVANEFIVLYKFQGKYRIGTRVNSLNISEGILLDEAPITAWVENGMAYLIGTCKKSRCGNPQTVSLPNGGSANSQPAEYMEINSRGEVGYRTQLWTETYPDGTFAWKAGFGGFELKGLLYILDSTNLIPKSGIYNAWIGNDPNPTSTFTAEAFITYNP